MNYLKNNIGTLILILLSFAVGAFAITISGLDFIKIFSYVVAVYLTIIGIYLIISAFYYQKFLTNKNHFLDTKYGYLVQGIILLALAVVLIIYDNYVVRIAIGITFIVWPTYQFILSNDKRRFMIRNAWKYVLGILFIFTVNIVIQILFIILGIALFGVAIYLIYLLILNRKDLDKPNILTKYLIIYFIKRNK